MTVTARSPPPARRTSTPGSATCRARIRACRELHTKFTYDKGAKFNFKGHDDVWVFIDNELVVDLGGIHDIGAKNVDLDTLSLIEGMSYTLDFFYAERHCCASNFVLSTSIAFTDCDIIVVK